MELVTHSSFECHLESQSSWADDLRYGHLGRAAEGALLPHLGLCLDRSMSVHGVHSIAV